MRSSAVNVFRGWELTTEDDNSDFHRKSKISSNFAMPGRNRPGITVGKPLVIEFEIAPTRQAQYLRKPGRRSLSKSRLVVNAFSYSYCSFRLAPPALVMVEIAFCNYLRSFLRKQQSKRVLRSLSSAPDGSRARWSQRYSFSKEFSCYV